MKCCAGYLSFKSNQLPPCKLLSAPWPNNHTERQLDHVTLLVLAIHWPLTRHSFKSVLTVRSRFRSLTFLLKRTLPRFPFGPSCPGISESNSSPLGANLAKLEGV
jgi:hypothetical protein